MLGWYNREYPPGRAFPIMSKDKKRFGMNIAGRTDGNRDGERVEGGKKSIMDQPE